VVERVKGIEPSYSAWKAAALPLSYTRAAPTLPRSAPRSTKKASFQFSTGCETVLTFTILFSRLGEKRLAGECSHVSNQPLTMVNSKSGQMWFVDDNPKADLSAYYLLDGGV
jgi:hypothetical protein